ncbi:hypothetical protein [Henriciella aquimarina]|uniref:hypothetical protein n=1 Tax=Henriciella aquimarina TaxID=545261 RepID=UPI0009FDDB13|nr:hypothetical protein [Henriciella aquimarina]
MLRYAPFVAALALVACDPGNPADPTDPQPVTPPENTSTDAGLDATPSAPADMPSEPANTGSPMESAGDAPEPTRQAAGDCGTITAGGLCGVEFGMTVQQARRAHEGELYELGDLDTEGLKTCYYLGPERDNYDIGYMVVDGEVQRIDIRAPGVSTSEGAQVGMPEGEVAGLYPDLERQPNKYTDRDNLVVTLEGGAKLIMETDENGLISTYRVGQPPAVDYVEGCA